MLNLVLKQNILAAIKLAFGKIRFALDFLFTKLLVSLNMNANMKKMHLEKGKLTLDLFTE